MAGHFILDFSEAFTFQGYAVFFAARASTPQDNEHDLKYGGQIKIWNMFTQDKDTLVIMSPLILQVFYYS
jgi:hypothetical protein